MDCDSPEGSSLIKATQGSAGKEVAQLPASCEDWPLIFAVAIVLRTCQADV